MKIDEKLALWLRWVAANALGEMLGLGLTFGVGVSIIFRMGDQQTVTAILIAFGISVVSGIIEATLVGLAQWWAMRPWFPLITRSAWWLATLIGALLAYVMGYLPSTLMSLGEQAAPSQAPAAEPAQWMVMLMAGGLGLVGGAVLSFAQWLTMRHKVSGSAVWIPANMLAWLVGMPLIFWGIDLSQKINGLAGVILLMTCILLLAGALVGAIHGAFLVRLIGQSPSPSPSTSSIISAT